MKRWITLLCLYLALIVALMFLATPPDPETASAKVSFEYQKF